MQLCHNLAVELDAGHLQTSSLNFIVKITKLSVKTEVLTSVVFTAGDHHNIPPAAMTMGATPSDVNPTGPNGDGPHPKLSELVQNQQQEAPWRTEVLDLLKQLVLVQKEIAKSQVQVVQLLGMLGTQVGQV